MKTAVLGHGEHGFVRFKSLAGPRGDRERIGRSAMTISDVGESSAIRVIFSIVSHEKLITIVDFWPFNHSCKPMWDFESRCFASLLPLPQSSSLAPSKQNKFAATKKTPHTFRPPLQTFAHHRTTTHSEPRTSNARVFSAAEPLPPFLPPRNPLPASPKTSRPWRLRRASLQLPLLLRLLRCAVIIQSTPPAASRP